MSESKTKMRTPGTWMQTYTGRRFWPLSPRAQDVCIDDIAHHLALKCRYNGAVREFYSVAEHSVIVSEAVPPEYAKEALLHDAGEAYWPDVCGRIKNENIFAPIRAGEDETLRVIYSHFGIVSTPASQKAIKEIDYRILVDEMSQLMEHGTWEPTLRDVLPLGVPIAALSPALAEPVFMARFRELFGWVS